MILVSTLKVALLEPYPAASCFLQESPASPFSLSVISNIPFLQPLWDLKSVTINSLLFIRPVSSFFFFTTYNFWSTSLHTILLTVSIHLSSCLPVNHPGNNQNINPFNYFLLFDDLLDDKQFCEVLGNHCKSTVSISIWKVNVVTSRLQSILQRKKIDLVKSWKNGNDISPRKYTEREWMTLV